MAGTGGGRSMGPSLAELLHDWHDFYVLVGTASATLVGLMFVAVSIGTSIFNEDHRAAMTAFITPTVMHFAAVLFVCLLGTIPTHTWYTLGGLLGAGALAGSIYSGRLVVQFAGPFAPILLGQPQLNHSPSSTIMYVAATKRLTHHGAKHMAAIAVERAQTAGIAIAVAVADAGGHLVVLERMDGGRFHTVHSATTKAVVAASNKRPTSARGAPAHPPDVRHATGRGLGPGAAR